MVHQPFGQSARQGNKAAYGQCARDPQRRLVRGVDACQNVVQMAELFEAVLGAIYLDGGLSETRRVYHTLFPFPDKLAVSGRAQPPSSPPPNCNPAAEPEPLAA